MDSFDGFFMNCKPTSMKNLTGRQLDYSFYDVTNYYTEKDFPDPDESCRDRNGNLVTDFALGQKKVSKEHQLTPIIQMGLFMNGIPVCMDVFRGNMSDSVTLRENLDGFKKEYGVEKTVVVADKGMNYSHNIDLLCSQGDGYVFSQILKGTKGKRYHKELFSLEGWHASKDGSYKWKLAEEEYTGYDIHFEMQDGEETEKKDLGKAKEEGSPILVQGGRTNGCPEAGRKACLGQEIHKKHAYSIVHGKDQYVMEKSVSKETGEILGDGQIAKVQEVDEQKAE